VFWTAGYTTGRSSTPLTRSPTSGAGSRRTPQRRGVLISENDTWIAACCLSEGLPLVTRNVKDFVDFAEHHGLVLITD
jgi:predicted nucleic acid-binding protein